MAPQLFGWQHLTYLAIFIVGLIATVVLTKIFIKTDKQRFILMKVVAAILFVEIIMNRISVAIRFHDAKMFIPNSYCGMTSLVLSLVVLFGRENNVCYQFLWYMGFVGGLATMIYPDFLSQDVSFWYLPTISGLLHHTVLLYLCVLLIEHKWFTPKLKYWWVFPAGIGMYTIFGLFCMQIFKWGDAMSINNPILDGTPLNWWFVLLVGTAGINLLLGGYELIKYLVKRKKAAPVAVAEPTTEDTKVEDKKEVKKTTAAKTTKTTKTTNKKPNKNSSKK